MGPNLDPGPLFEYFGSPAELHVSHFFFFFFFRTGAGENAILYSHYIFYLTVIPPCSSGAQTIDKVAVYGFPSNFIIKQLSPQFADNVDTGGCILAGLLILPKLRQ